MTDIDASWATLWDSVVQAVPDRIAIRAGGESTTYAQLEDRAARLAAMLKKNDIGRGSKVACYLYNRPEYLEVIYAALKIGAVPVNMNFRYRAEELGKLIAASDTEALVFPSSLADHIPRAVELSGRPVVLVEIDDGGAGTVPDAIAFDDAINGNEPLPPQGEIGGDDEIFIFTGGTTGSPKAVIWRQAQLFDSQLFSAYGALGLDAPTTIPEVGALASDPATPSVTTLPITPLMHAMAMFNSMNTLLLGGRVVFLGKQGFDAVETLRLVKEEQVTRVIIAGNAVSIPLADELDRASVAGAPWDISSVTSIMSSGMTWTDAAKARLLQHSRAQLVDIVGSSEGGPFAYGVIPAGGSVPTRLTLAPGAVVLDDSGRELASGIGILAYRGAMPLGYYKDPVKTAQVYRQIGDHRYVAPGDYVRLLGDGNIEFLGRDSAVVNTGGEKVYPAEVEEALLSHPQIVDCVVYGIPDEKWGEMVATTVQLSPNSQITTEAITEYLSGFLAGYKKPRRIVIVDSLERTPTGKISLPELKKQTTAATTSKEKRMSDEVSAVGSTIDDLPGLVGKTLGPSSWRTITSEEVGGFAHLTGDYNPIHIDEDAGAKSPFGTTIVHGYFTLSLVVPLMEEYFTVDAGTSVNYGLDKLRFPAPVPVGSRIRTFSIIREVTEIAGGVQVAVDTTFEIEGGTKPVAFAQMVLRYYA